MGEVETLHQRRGLERRSFRIAEDGVHVSYSRLMGDQRFRVPFENVPDDTIETTKRRPVWVALAAILLAFSVLGVILNLEQGQAAMAARAGVLGLALAAACTGAFVLTRRNLVAFATGDDALVFFASSPSPDAVKKFISSVIAARDAYLRTRYERPVPGESPIDAIERLHALREKGVISEQEFSSLKAKVVSDNTAPPPYRQGGTYL